MTQAFNSNTFVYVFVVLIAAIILFAVLYEACLFISAFSRELRYLNNEISRTVGAERHRWIRQRRRLWLSLIPFVKYG